MLKIKAGSIVNLVKKGNIVIIVGRVLVLCMGNLKGLSQEMGKQFKLSRKSA